MKPTVSVAVILLDAAASAAAAMTLEDLAPHFPASTEIVWGASVAPMPAALPIYSTRARHFSRTTISNAMVLAGFPPKGRLPAVLGFAGERNWAGIGFAVWISCQARDGISYQGLPDRNDPDGVPSAEEVSRRAWQYVALLGIDRSELFEKLESHTAENCHHGQTNRIASRATFLSRWVGGLEIREFGFRIRFGAHSQITDFGLFWPNLRRAGTRPLARPQQLVQCIRAHKTPLALVWEQDGDWAVLNLLTNAAKFTITRVTPVYTERGFGPERDGQPQTPCFAPWAELEGTAQLGKTNLNTRLLVPLLSEDVVWLLALGSPGGH